MVPSSLLFKTQLLALGSSLLLSVFYGMVNHANTVGNESKQGSFMIVLAVIFLHFGYLITSNTIYLLKIKPIYKNKFLRAITYFIGILAIMVPTTILSINDMMKSNRHEDEKVFIFMNLTLLIIWSLGYLKLNRSKKVF